jgi:hypothetical protein
MVSTDPKDKPFYVPPRHCWVAADDAALPVALAADSRLFGPVPYATVLGRAVYYCRSEVEHGQVTNR